jgi:hypothetical protein
MALDVAQTGADAAAATVANVTPVFATLGSKFEVLNGEGSIALQISAVEGAGNFPNVILNLEKPFGNRFRFGLGYGTSKGAGDMVIRNISSGRVTAKTGTVTGFEYDMQNGLTIGFDSASFKTAAGGKVKVDGISLKKKF